MRPPARRGTLAPRFLCDVMLGRLARWLRALGIDTAYDGEAEDRELLRRAARQGRVLLTRDRRIGPPPKGVSVVVLRANDTPAQLRETLATLAPAPLPEPFTRCLQCNTRLRRARAEEIEARVPAFVRATGNSFTACGRCRRVYWPGTHRRMLTRALSAALGDGGAQLRRAAEVPPRPDRGGRG